MQLDKKSWDCSIKQIIEKYNTNRQTRESYQIFGRQKKNTEMRRFSIRKKILLFSTNCVLILQLKVFIIPLWTHMRGPPPSMFNRLCVGYVPGESRKQWPL